MGWLICMQYNKKEESTDPSFLCGYFINDYWPITVKIARLFTCWLVLANSSSQDE